MKTPRIVGKFIRERRESLSLSQRALGQLFDPPVTTQFISNVERGVTPLPPAHVPTLARALSVSENEMMALLQREYALKLSGRVGLDGAPEGERLSMSASATSVEVDPSDREFIKQLYAAYRKADEQSKKAFLTVCRSMLKIHVEPALAPRAEPAPVKPTV